MAVRITAELAGAGRTATGIPVPDEVVEGLGGGKHPKVAVEVNGFRFRTSIGRMGERYMIPVSGERRREAGVQAGDVVEVEIELDTAPRTVEVPDDLAAALAANPAAAAFWNTLSYSAQSWHALQVTGAKKPETRAKRVSASVAMLAEGRAR